MVKGPEKPAVDEAADKKAARPAFTLKPSKQTCIVLGGLTAVVLGSAVGLYAWQSGEVAEIEAQATTKRQQVADAEKITNQLTDKEKEYQTMLGQLRYLETSVSPAEYVPTLLDQIERLAKQTNLTVQALRPTLEPAPSPPADEAARKTFKPWPYDKLHMDLDINGDYWSIARVLYRFTEFEKIIWVENVQLTPVANTTDLVPRLNAKIKMTGFIFMEEPEPATAKPPDEEKPAADPAAPKTTSALSLLGYTSVLAKR